MSKNLDFIITDQQLDHRRIRTRIDDKIQTIKEVNLESSGSLNSRSGRDLLESFRRGGLSGRSRLRCGRGLCRGGGLGLRTLAVLLEAILDKVEVRAPVQGGVVDITVRQSSHVREITSRRRGRCYCRKRQSYQRTEWFPQSR